jgi:hypothetical protein
MTSIPEDKRMPNGAGFLLIEGRNGSGNSNSIYYVSTHFHTMEALTDHLDRHGVTDIKHTTVRSVGLASKLVCTQTWDVTP